jgi:hypothetical protein
MFQILLKANVLAAVLRDSHGRYLLHYACRHLRSISCATKIIEALLVAHKEAAMGIDSDECYAVTTAGNHYLLVLYQYLSLLFLYLLFLLFDGYSFTAFTLFMSSFFTLFSFFLTSSHLFYSLFYIFSCHSSFPRLSTPRIITFSHPHIIPSLNSPTPAQFSTVEVVKLLYAAYPAATLIDHDNYKRNVIHNGIYNNTDPAMMDYLCVSFPDALQGFSQDRYVRTPHV